MNLGRFARSAALCALLLAAATPRAQAQTEPLRVGIVAGDGFAEAYYAQELGLFKDAGMRVDIRTFSSGIAIATGVAAGTIDVGISNPVYLAEAVAHGVPFVFLAAGGMYSSRAPTLALVSTRTSPLRTAADLQGKTVAISGRGDQNQVAIDAWMDRSGADFTKIHFLFIPFAEMHPALADGLADAAVLAEPWLSEALAAGDTRVLARPWDAVGPQLLTGIWFTTAQWYARHRAEGRRFAAVISATARWANLHPDRSAPMLARLTKIGPQTIRTMTRSRFETALEPSLIQTQLNLAYRYHILDQPMTAVNLIAR
jgi:NitT/TauT family transport system substrate-binding protein